jgi:hypothetical protein
VVARGFPPSPVGSPHRPSVPSHRPWEPPIARGSPPSPVGSPHRPWVPTPPVRAIPSPVGAPTLPRVGFGTHDGPRGPPPGGPRRLGYGRGGPGGRPCGCWWPPVRLVAARAVAGGRPSVWWSPARLLVVARPSGGRPWEFLPQPAGRPPGPPLLYAFVACCARLARPASTHPGRGRDNRQLRHHIHGVSCNLSRLARNSTRRGAGPG